MPTVRARLLTWNPDLWNWTDQAERAEEVASGEDFEERWSCSRITSIEAGERAYLMRVGVEPRGIVASGWVVRGSYEDQHWDPERAEQGDTCYFVMVRFDRLATPEEGVLVPRSILVDLPGPERRWSPQSSGTTLPAEAAEALEAILAAGDPELPEELPALSGLPEGSRRTVQVNTYERNRLARSRCLEHHGLECAVCGVSLEERYGPAAEGLIHVHHLKPISEVGEAYVVDPVEDLRPVCPNCHAVIHRRTPPYSIEDVQEMLQANQKG